MKEAEDSPLPLSEEIKEIEETQLEDEEYISNQEELKLDSTSWNNIFQSLDLDLGTKQLASHCSFLRTDDSVIYLSMPEEKLTIFSGKHRQKLQESVSLSLGSDCILFFEAGAGGDESPNKLKLKERDKINQEAKNAIKEDPDVKILLDKLGGKVIDSSIEPRQSDE